MSEYVIVDNEGSYWSNEDGWVEDAETATRFDQTERDTLNLPFGGSWVEAGK